MRQHRQTNVDEHLTSSHTGTGAAVDGALEYEAYDYVMRHVDPQLLPEQERPKHRSLVERAID